MQRSVGGRRSRAFTSRISDIGCPATGCASGRAGLARLSILESVGKNEREYDAMVTLNAPVRMIRKWVLVTVVLVVILVLVGIILLVRAMQVQFPEHWLVISLIVAIVGVVIPVIPKFQLSWRLSKLRRMESCRKPDPADGQQQNHESQVAVPPGVEVRNGVPIVWNGFEFWGFVVSAVSLIAALLTFVPIGQPIEACAGDSNMRVCATDQNGTPAVVE